MKILIYPAVALNGFGYNQSEGCSVNYQIQTPSNQHLYTYLFSRVKLHIYRLPERKKIQEMMMAGMCLILMHESVYTVIDKCFNYFKLAVKLVATLVYNACKLVSVTCSHPATV